MECILKGDSTITKFFILLINKFNVNYATRNHRLAISSGKITKKIRLHINNNQKHAKKLNHQLYPGSFRWPPIARISLMTQIASVFPYATDASDFAYGYNGFGGFNRTN